MRIAYYIPGWPPETVPNGIVTSLSQLSVGLKKNGHEVFFITPSSTINVLPENVVVLPTEHVSLFDRVAYKWDPYVAYHQRYSDRIASALSHLCAEHNIDIFEIEDSHGWATQIAKGAGIPVVVRLHGPWFIHSRFHAGGGDCRHDKTRIKLEGEALRAASAITAPSRNVLDMTQEHYGDFLRPSRVIPNPAPFVTPENCWDIKSCDRNCILFVGRFDSHKGGDIVLDAFAEVQKAYSDMKLIFVGPDIGIEDAERRLTRLTEFLHERFSRDTIERIEVRGGLPRSDILSLRKRAFLTVVSSRYETFCNTVVEAMAAGSPLVASNTGGIPELVTHERNGLLVAPANVSELVLAIIRMLRDPDLAVRLGTKAREDCYNLVDSSSIACHTAEFYSDIIARYRR